MEMPAWDDEVLMNFETPEFSPAMWEEPAPAPEMYCEVAETMVMRDEINEWERMYTSAELCQVDEYFSDILLGSDPLVAL